MIGGDRGGRGPHDVYDTVVAAEAATARAHGLAALERARGEVAATRALANAARMLTDNPGLLQLRTLQAVETGGATVVLSNEPGAATSAPVRPRRS